MPALSRRLVAEGVGTAFLLAAIVGSGIMAERLAAGNVAIALLCNSLATGAMLYVLITILAPVSGAHLNPAVTLAFLIRGSIGTAACRRLYRLPNCRRRFWDVDRARHVWAADLAALHHRTSRNQPLVGRSRGDLRVILTILGALRWKPEAIPSAVGLYIVSAYWFTASTSFANPAVTVAEVTHGHVLRYTPCWGARIRDRSACRGAVSDGLFGMAVRDLEIDSHHLTRAFGCKRSYRRFGGAYRSGRNQPDLMAQKVVAERVGLTFPSNINGKNGYRALKAPFDAQRLFGAVATS